MVLREWFLSAKTIRKTQQYREPLFGHNKGPLSVLSKNCGYFLTPQHHHHHHLDKFQSQSSSPYQAQKDRKVWRFDSDSTTNFSLRKLYCCEYLRSEPATKDSYYLFTLRKFTYGHYVYKSEGKYRSNKSIR